MYKGALDPEWIADGLSSESQQALIDKEWAPELSNQVDRWRGELMLWQDGVALASLGHAVRAVLLRRQHEAAMSAEHSKGQGAAGG